MIRCSVVVPTCNRPDLLSRALGALTAQSLAPAEYEIIICDVAGTDATREVVARWQGAQAVSITHITGPKQPGHGIAAMRNAGWRAARGQFVAFTNDDAVPDQDWLRQGLLALDDDAADAAGGRIVIPPPDESAYDTPANERLDAATFVTVNCFCRRRVLECIGGFNPRARAARAEGRDLLAKLIRSGFDVVHAIDAVVVYPVSSTRPGQSPHAARSRLAYAILGCLAMVIFGMALDSPDVAAIAISAWACLTVMLVARLLDADPRRPVRVREAIGTSLALPFLSVYHGIRNGTLFRVAVR